MALHGIGNLGDLHLARVVENDDPAGRGRVKLTLLALEMEVWASLVVPSAGPGYGVALLPKVDEVVVVGFVTPELPLVLGSIWSGDDGAPEAAEPAERRYAVTTPAGTVLLMDDGADGPRLKVTTPAGHRLELGDGEGGHCTAEVGGSRVTVTPTKVEVSASAEVTVNAPAGIKLTTAQLTVDAAASKFSGVVQCPTLIATSVVGTSYTPGAGNIW